METKIIKHLIEKTELNKTMEELNEEIEKVGIELYKAKLKHPNYPSNLHKRMSILTEEVGEVAKAILDYEDGGEPRSHIKHELRQAAAMCFRFLKHLNEEDGVKDK